MRASIILAAHNEGRLLSRTVTSVRETMGDLDAEIIIVDDASEDGSIRSVRDAHRDVRIDSSRRREGVSRTKDRGAKIARGNVLVFLDGHCKPERRALGRLVEDVELASGKAIFTPRICPLDPQTWQNRSEQSGHGYYVCPQTMTLGWRELAQLRPQQLSAGVANRNRRFVYESPTFQGCAVAMSRQLYQQLRGFDTDMLFWGSEDVDLGLKSWLLGYPVWHDPEPLIGHRYQKRFDHYQVPAAHILANQLRLGRKLFGDEGWVDWLSRFRNQHTPSHWRAGWNAYAQRKTSVEEERRYLLEHRVHDEFWYFNQFKLHPGKGTDRLPVRSAAESSDPRFVCPTIDPEEGDPSPRPSTGPSSPSPPSPSPSSSA